MVITMVAITDTITTAITTGITTTAGIITTITGADIITGTRRPWLASCAARVAKTW